MSRQRSRILVDLTPLRRFPHFRRLWLGQLVSQLGSALTTVAVPYQVYRLTRSSFAVGMVSLVQLAPLLIGSLLGGSIADAFDRRKVLLGSQIALTGCSTGLAFNAMGGHPALWPLFVLPAVAAGFSGMDSSTRTAAMVSLVGPEALVSANALRQLLLTVSLVAGPAVAGLILGRFGAVSVYWTDVASFAAAMVAVLRLPTLRPAGGGTRAGLRSMLEGLRYLKGRQALQGTFVVDLNAMIFGMPRALFPAMGIDVFHGGATAVGFLYAAPGAGALLGALFTGWAPRVRRQGRAVLIAVALWGLAVAAFGLVTWLPAALALLALAGAADVVSAVFRGAILQVETPDRLGGRLFSIQIAVVTGGPRLGDAEAGLVAAFAGVRASVVSGGLACVVGAALLGRLLPGFTGYETATEGRVSSWDAGAEPRRDDP
jgi:MFS family permease